ncbi:hypothetical protein PIB30_097115, partial [Stylosanthes scabra]|nr:hypothetical protein [Stylosanthes scabra]
SKSLSQKKFVFLHASFSTRFYTRSIGSRNDLPSRLQTAGTDGSQRTDTDNGALVAEPWREGCSGHTPATFPPMGTQTVSAYCNSHELPRRTTGNLTKEHPPPYAQRTK